MGKTHIIAHSSEILSKGKTLDRELNEINNKVNNIKTDGTLVATDSKLGNVIVGSNINVNNGTISVPIANQTAPGVVKISQSYSGDTHDLCTAVNSVGEIAIKKATTDAFGVVKIGDLLKIDSETGKLTIDVAALKTELGIS